MCGKKFGRLVTSRPKDFVPCVLVYERDEIISTEAWKRLGGCSTTFLSWLKNIGRECKVTYTLEGFIGKINYPVTIEINGNEVSFGSGEEAMAAKWQERMRVVSIIARKNSIVLKMERINSTPPVNWIGEEAIWGE